MRVVLAKPNLLWVGAIVETGEILSAVTLGELLDQFRQDPEKKIVADVTTHDSLEWQWNNLVGLFTPRVPIDGYEFGIFGS